MLARRFRILLCTILLSVLILLLACSKKSRYRVLTFFFDGVPPPISTLVDEATEPIPDFVDEADSQADSVARLARAPVQYPHPPYRNGKCGSCHNPADSQLFKTPQEGLCLSCHAELIADKIYLHGPVAVNACLNCHHHHASIHPKVLLRDINETCSQCHDLDDVKSGAHHDTIADGTCVACHNPHGGENRFFLTIEWRADP